MRLAASAALALAAILAACAPKPPPPPPPPPVVVIPPVPQPPMGAPDHLTIPPVNASGQRETVNYGISSVQTVWNLRSAYNVAALNCIGAQYAPILDGYKRFLIVYDKALDNANREIDRSFKSQLAGRAATVARETYQTQVYNFFALPPVTPAMCQAAMELTTELAAIPAEQFVTYSYVGLAKMEAPYKAFYDSYEQYMADLAAWEAKYGGRIIVRASTATQGASYAPAPSPAPAPAPSSTAQSVQQPIAPQPQTRTVSQPVVQGAQPQPAPSITLPYQTTVPEQSYTLPPQQGSIVLPNVDK